jgi:DNA-binding transcriptional LysR family regulator
MVAVRIGPPLRMAVVGSTSYFADRPLPKKPDDLARHLCINLRLPTRGGLYAWEFERRGRPVNVRVDGQLILNDATKIVRAAVDGFGLACLPEGMVTAHIAAGRLVRVLDDWCPPFPGYHLYYPTRRQNSPAFAVILEALRERQ